MKNFKWIIIFFALLLCNGAKAQKPSNDVAWVLQTNLSDEFDSTALRTYRWNPNYWGGFQISNGAEVNYPSNLLFNSSTLRIKADTLSPNYFESDTTLLWYDYNSPNQGLTFAYQGGVIQSKQPSYKFGYIEIFAKFPSKKHPLWPAFWLFGSNCTTHYYNETDCAENDALQSFLGNKVGNNWHVGTDSCYFKDAAHGGWDVPVLASNDSLSGGFHKFAVQWDPRSVSWFFDDNLTSYMYNINGTDIPQNTMGLILNFCIDPRSARLPADWTGTGIAPYNNVPNPYLTSWPKYFEIDYVRYYKLSPDCSSDLTICTPSDYNRTVKRSITTNSSCTPTYNPSTSSSSYTLRATDYILINEGTTINPTGTGYFAAEIQGCPQ